MFLFYVFLFIIGLCLGSFLNVVIDRWPHDKSIVSGRSHCDFCQHKLGVFDLIPVISFFILGGKCRYCHKNLSFQYPIIEFTSGILLVLTSALSANNIFLMLMSLYMVVIFMVDLKYEIVLEKVINSAIILSLLYNFTRTNFLGNLNGFITPIISAVLAAIFFLFLIFVSRGRGLGQGDVKLGFWMGLLLGIKIIPAFFIAFILGAVVGIILIITKKKHFGQTVPLAPFLMIGTYVALFWGNQIISWYLAQFIGL